MRNAWWSRFANIGFILALFVVMAIVYSLATPIFEKPDEMWHLAYAKRLADGLGYPDAPIVIRDDVPAQESSQPPLYYTLAAFFVHATVKVPSTSRSVEAWVTTGS